MAQLVTGRIRVEDAAGDPVNGGRLRLYDANTTNLTSIWLDAGLSTPASNPLSADSAGWLPQFFTTEGVVVDGTFLNPVSGGGAEIGPAFVDAVFVGDSTGTLTRDFTNSRFQIRGSGGTVYIEAGDPSPDNVGGTASIGGWAGTTADLITLNGPTNINSDTFTVNSKTLPSVVYTGATAFSGSQDLIVPLTNSPTGIRAWEIELFDWFLSTTAGVYLAFSYDNGATYKTGATDYARAMYAYETTGPSLQAAVTTGEGASGGMVLHPSTLNTPTNKPGWLRLKILTPNSGNDATLVKFETQTYTLVGPVPNLSLGAGWAVGNYGRATHARIRVSSGTHLGNYTVRTLRGYN